MRILALILNGCPELMVSQRSRRQATSPMRRPKGPRPQRMRRMMNRR